MKWILPLFQKSHLHVNKSSRFKFNSQLMCLCHSNKVGRTTVPWQHTPGFSLRLPTKHYHLKCCAFQFLCWKCDPCLKTLFDMWAKPFWLCLLNLPELHKRHLLSLSEVVLNPQHHRSAHSWAQIVYWWTLRLIRKAVMSKSINVYFILAAAIWNYVFPLQICFQIHIC